jgi:hypothetical protein
MARTNRPKTEKNKMETTEIKYENTPEYFAELRKYTMENTEGFTQPELDRMNRRLLAEFAKYSTEELADLHRTDRGQNIAETIANG